MKDYPKAKKKIEGIPGSELLIDKMSEDDIGIYIELKGRSTLAELGAFVENLRRLQYDVHSYSLVYFTLQIILDVNKEKNR